MTKISYLDETLKRLPIILLFGSIGWYGLNMLFEIKADVKEMKMLTFKDKEAIDSQMAAVTLQVQNNSNRTNEIEKDVIRLLAIMPNRVEAPKIKENEN
jgi:hypothetical protein